MGFAIKVGKFLLGHRARPIRLRVIQALGGRVDRPYANVSAAPPPSPKETAELLPPDQEKAPKPDPIVSKLEGEVEALSVFAGIIEPRLRYDGPVTCRMADGAYVQSDGSLPCYCSGGITRNLGKTNGRNFMDFYRGKVMTTLRRHLAEGVFPWPECSYCHVKNSTPEAATLIQPDRISIIHVEPTSICNLRCPGCHATDRMEGRTARRRDFLPLSEFKELIDSIDIPVTQIAFCCYGEPLLNPDVPKMIAYAKERMDPAPSCTIDTNANIRKIDVDELIDSGVNLIRFALDGAIQENYEKYRRKGNLELGLDFVRRVAEARDRKKAKTLLVWKYVIFAHGSSIDEIERAIRFCSEVGIAFDYSRAAGILPGAGDRLHLESQIQKLLDRYGVIDVVGGAERKENKMKYTEDSAWKYA